MTRCSGQDGYVGTRSVSQHAVSALGHRLLTFDRLRLELWPSLHRRDVQHHAVRGHVHADVPVLQHVQGVSTFIVPHSFGSRVLTGFGLVIARGLRFS